MAKVFLGIPTYDNQMHIYAARGLMQASRKHSAQVAFMGSSLLGYGFNNLWAGACESDCDYFAMLHADIGPQERFWLDILIEELERTEADILSAVVPIKSDERIYSVALGHPDCEVHYRLHVDHLVQLPQTFGGEDLREVTGQEGVLCINTGLFVARLGQEWQKHVHFEIKSSIYWKSCLCAIPSHSKPRSTVIPEDWNFSYQAAQLGLKVLATTIVPVHHAGTQIWDSRPAETTELLSVPI